MGHSIPPAPDAIPMTVDAQNKAFAGVGNPRNPVVCRASILNLASLQADAIGMVNAIMTKLQLDHPISSGSRCHDNMNTTIPGATPNVTISAKLSSCAPSGVPPPKARAASPSNTSNSAPANTSQHAHVSCPCEASKMEPTPQARFAVVKRSGILGKRAIELRTTMTVQRRRGAEVGIISGNDPGHPPLEAASTICE